MSDSISQDVPKKQCRLCLNVYPADNEHFHRQQQSKDGWNTICKECVNAPRRKPPAEKESFPEGMKRCPTCQRILVASTEYFHAKKASKDGLESRCKMCVCEYGKQYREAHKEELAEKKRQYAQTHRDLFRASSKKYYQTDRGKLVYRANFHKRVARKKSTGGSYTPQQLLDQKKRQRSRCYYCSVKLGHVFHADHIVPLSRGGSNDISNIVLTCPACNRQKGNKLPHEWGRRLL